MKTALGSRMKRVILWAIPRSRSTAFERSVMQRKDTQVYHELFTGPFFYKHARVHHDIMFGAHKQYGLPADDPTYQEALALMLSDFTAQGKQILFSKELSCSFDFDLIDSDWLAQFKHTFLIRPPLDMMKSYYRVSQTDDAIYFDPTEAGYEEMCRIYRLVCDACGEDNTLVIDADDDLMQATEITLQRFCRFMDIPFDINMLAWDPCAVPAWQKLKAWHKDAEKSSKFIAIAHNPMEFPDIVYKSAEKHQAYYQLLNSKRQRSIACL